MKTKSPVRGFLSVTISVKSWLLVVMTKTKVVILGGGTGTYTVLRGLSLYADTLALTAVVSMADSGGSTGRLRDAYGMLPVGDARMALTALARTDTLQQELLRELLMYRFPKGDGLAGHNLGNLLLVALSDMLGSEAAAISAAAALFSVQGTVLPITNDQVTLCAEYTDGSIVRGEHTIDAPQRARHSLGIAQLYLEEPHQINPPAAEALAQADYIIVGPGDLYTSLVATAVVDGVAEAVRDSTATFVYVGNIMTRPGQTIGLRARDHQAEITRYFCRMPDVTIVNSAPLPPAAVAAYQGLGTAPVVDDLPVDTSVYRCPLLARELVTQSVHDTVARSLIRHDSELLARALVDYMTNV